VVLVATTSLKGRRTALIVIVSTSVVLLALIALSLSTRNFAQFGLLQPWILLASLLMALGLLIMLGRKVWQLVKAYRAGVPGSRFTARTVLVFGALVALPLVTVYLFSLDFLNRGIDSWFRVEIRQGLNDAVELSRSALDLRMREHAERIQRFSDDIAGLSAGERLLELDAELRESSAAELVIYGEFERILGASSRSVRDALPERPGADLVRQVTDGRTYAALEPLNDGYIIRVAAPVPRSTMGDGDARFVVAIFDLPREFAELTNAVQRSFSQYGDLAALREPLKYSFRATLTVVLLVTLLGAIYGALYFAEILFKPVQDLMAGTRAVAKGDFGTRVPLSSRDEMGFLVHSFNDMTKRLRRARSETERSREAVEMERERLAVILARLSTGVLTVDRGLVLRLSNTAAESILGVPLANHVGESLSRLSAGPGLLGSFVEALQTRFDAGREEWREQLELRLTHQGGERVLVCACVPLTPVTEGSAQYVIVFDDVTHLLQAQREAAWGEVARRLAHEIKNPLTPIQLSAERLRRRLMPALQGSDAEMVDRSTHTIVQQVEAMKQMVNDFSEYARAPGMQIAAFDVQSLLGEVMDLYRAREGGPRIQSSTAAEVVLIEADRSRLRQVLNNLLSNAVEALEGRADGDIQLEILNAALEGQAAVEIRVSDNGPGFPSELLPRVFDPYVTSKPRGTGLGLAIVRKIVEDHGGSIEAENRRSGGARVRVILPIKQKPKTLAARERRQEPRRELA
jgi:nitrogen fixation/metabolism regulation signal transduction histidine kinase